MTFRYRTNKKLGMTLAGRVVESGDPEAVAELVEGTLIPIDDAERLGITTEKEEREKANRGKPLGHKFTKDGDNR